MFLFSSVGGPFIKLPGSDGEARPLVRLEARQGRRGPRPGYAWGSITCNWPGVRALSMGRTPLSPAGEAHDPSALAAPPAGEIPLGG